MLRMHEYPLIIFEKIVLISGLVAIKNLNGHAVLPGDGRTFFVSVGAKF